MTDDQRAGDQPPVPQPAAAPPAGWYPDPENPGGQRYWDGRGWTENRVGYPAAPPATAVPKRRSGFKIFLIVASAIIVAIVVLVVGCAALIGAGVDSAVEESNEHAITKAQYDSIENGMSRSEVEDELGPPGDAQDFDLEGLPDSSCIYYNETDELLGNYFQFCFDDDELTSKSAY
jgi:hypothetical protein